MTASILVFTKNPGLTPAKTRLRASCSLDDAILDALAAAFVIDTLTSAHTLSGSPLFIASEPISTAAHWRKLAGDYEFSQREDFLDGAVFLSQRGSCFTSRLQNAIHDVSRASVGGLIILGSDAPLLSPGEIAHALVSVEQGNLVLGPSPGGGIYLIGIPNQAISSVADTLSGVFDADLHSELELLSERSAALGVPVQLLNTHIDVDTEDDLGSIVAIAKADKHASLSSVSRTARATKKVIREHGLALRRCKENNRIPNVVSNLHS